jgi:HD-GYP domain-containing protein (c-di-GMP phosphodiesterase class II)
MLASTTGMPRLLPLVTGMAAGAAIVWQRRERERAERLAAALLETLLRAIDANDGDTGHHVRRVARYALTLSDAAGLDHAAQSSVERVALFHDIGKIHEALFDLIHDKSTLSPEDRRAVATHPRRGSEVLAPLSAFYPTLADSVHSHHEWWDGTGYPRGLAGDAIPLESRIVAIADAFDAITYRRRYSNARDAEEAAESIAEGRGTQFDPDLTDLFLSPPVFGEMIKLLRAPKAPKPRRRPSGKTMGAPDVSFRWRTRSHR